jgi:hypothetical protein
MTDDQNAIWVQCPKSLLTILPEQQTRVWHDIVTLDESWFSYITDHELIWLPPHGKVPDLERVKIQSKKVIPTIVWVSTGFAVVTALDRGCKFNAGYYVSKVLTPLSEWWRERGCRNFRKLIVHADNAPPTRPRCHNSSWPVT